MKNIRLEYRDRKKSRWTILENVFLVVLLYCLCQPWILFAQDTKGSKAHQLETITVTAQKQQKEDVQEVPISISVLDTRLLEDAQVATIVELSDFVPNLFVYEMGPGTNLPTMRGITAPVETFQVSTGIYIDGTPVISTAGYTIDLLDIERVEVLRGPQGTLYGNGAQAGVINIITRRPGNAFFGNVSMKAGSWISSEEGKLLGKTSISLNGPIVQDQISFRLAGQYEHKDGYIQNILTKQPENKRNSWFGKGLLYFNPSDKLDISLLVSHMNNDSDNPNLVLPEKGYAIYPYPYPGYRKTATALSEQYNDNTEDLQTLKVDYQLTDKLTLSSVTANWDSHSGWFNDYDYIPLEIAHQGGIIDIKRLSEELRLGYVNGKFKWLVGFYGDKYDRNGTVWHESMFPNYRLRTEENVSGNTYAFFSNIIYPVTEKLSVSAGLRYETSEQDYEEKLSGAKTDDSWDSTTPKFSVHYQLSPTAMVYASAAKCYRPGGFNGAYATSEYRTYDSEELWSYETGTKTIFFNNTLTFNASVFYINISNMQVSQFMPGGGQAFLTNAARATSKGAELEMIWLPVQGLTLSAGFGYTNIEFDTFSDAAGEYKGNKNPWVPNYTFHLGAQYRHQTGWYARTDVNGVGKMFFDKANQYAIDPYALVNMKIGYEWENIDVYLYGKNIFDKKYDYEGAYGGVANLLNEPGQVGLQVTYRF